MKVNFAVCGKFHLAYYIKSIADAGALNRFYFSHKLGAEKLLSLRDKEAAVNLPAAAYVMHGAARLLGDRVQQLSYSIAGAIWARQVAARWKPADIFQFLAHGHALDLMSLAKSEGSVVVAEAVNTHPHYQREILNREADHWGISSAVTQLNSRERRLVDELERADHVLVPTRTVQQSMMSYGIDANKLIKIPYATNLDRFSGGNGRVTMDRKARPLKVICVGSVTLRKGQLYLLEACRVLGPSVVQLTLVGALSNSIAPLVAKYDGQFRHVSRIPNEQLRDLLLDHDLFVLPSLEEGLALSIGEAAASGLPILATRESGAEEILVEGETGFFVKAASTDALAERLLYLAQNREMVERVGFRAGEHAKNELDWQKYATKLLDTYKGL